MPDEAPKPPVTMSVQEVETPQNQNSELENKEVNLVLQWNEVLFQETVKKVLKMKDKERTEAILRDINKLAAVVQILQAVGGANLQNFRSISKFIDDMIMWKKSVDEKLALIEAYDKTNGGKKAGHYTA